MALGFQIESSLKSTAENEAGNWQGIDFVEGEFELIETKPNRQEIRTIGSGRNTSRVVDKGYSNGEGTLELRSMTPGIWLYHALGNCSTTSDNGTPNNNTHNITEANSLPSFALHVQQEGHA